MLAYCKAAEIVHGNVLEIGTGSGYGVSVIAPHADRFTTIDKTPPPAGILPEGSNVEFCRMKAPPLKEYSRAAWISFSAFRLSNTSGTTSVQ